MILEPVKIDRTGSAGPRKIEYWEISYPLLYDGLRIDVGMPFQETPGRNTKLRR